MIARPAINAQKEASQGPAWGLKEQLGRVRKSGGGSAGEENQNRGDKIRMSVTGPALAHKIEEVRMPVVCTQDIAGLRV